MKYAAAVLVYPRMVLGLSEAAGVGEYAAAVLVYPWDGAGIE